MRRKKNKRERKREKKNENGKQVGFKGWLESNSQKK